MAAPLERTVSDEPGRVTFELRFFDWDVRLILEPLVDRLPAPERDSTRAPHLVMSAWIRPRNVGGRATSILSALAARTPSRTSLDGWRCFSQETIETPLNEPRAERVLWNVKTRLYRLREVNGMLNKTAFSR
jgi:hypothetical protein